MSTSETSDADLVVSRSVQIEEMLRVRFGAVGRGLGAKAWEVRDSLPALCEVGLQRVTQVRNKFMHEVASFPVRIGNRVCTRDDFDRLSGEVLAVLRELKDGKRLAATASPQPLEDEEDEYDAFSKKLNAELSKTGFLLTWSDHPVCNQWIVSAPNNGDLFRYVIRQYQDHVLDVTLRLGLSQSVGPKRRFKLVDDLNQFAPGPSRFCTEFRGSGVEAGLRYPLWSLPYVTARVILDDIISVLDFAWGDYLEVRESSRKILDAIKQIQKKAR